MKFIITGKTFDNSDYKKEVNDITELWNLLKQISLDFETRPDRVISSTIEVETVDKSKEIILNYKKIILPSICQIDKIAYRYALKQFPTGNTGDNFKNCEKDYFNGSRDMLDDITKKIKSCSLKKN